ncbi:WD40/YVTN/BNR-like repeat-containing protein [Nocardioides marmoribigeumensis]|uniref:Exo-alpha-sialidase n=1 Tax=Nocardioides marmoribigeumensis TaxID=433649 RepID=A0ABU2BRS9_9ACTN|nr:sialidase family protein [Nocardioides marmoribigeumensis]MDR7361342.1 hypothetical protein [Nocardioides marmoribigeumensis]
MKHRSWIALIAVLLMLAAVGCTSGGGDRSSSAHPGVGHRDGDFAAESEDEEESEERPNGYAEPRKEARFETAVGEADRKGPSNPAAEQVDNRAYPRSYVDDKRSRGARAKYQRTAHKADRSDYGSQKTFAASLSATPGAWQALGPVTPDVASQASQFYDYRTQSGPSTQESGRVTALAIDPSCGKSSAPSGAPCRLWVAAAGGGIWRTDDALAAHPAWIAPPGDLPTNAFGSLVVDPNDASGNTLYAGSGEPNGSGDSEAGLGLFKSTDGGRSWSLVPGSASVATNRSIGSIAIRQGRPDTIVIGTAVARHGSSSVNGGRRTPPNAPALGVYRSTDGGASFTLSTDLQSKTPANGTPPGAGTGSDWFQGGVTKLQFDPVTPGTLYAGVLGYGVWRSADGGATWTQVFQTMNPDDLFGDRTEFSAVPLGGGRTRIYLGDSSDDLGVAKVYRTDDAAAIAGAPDGGYDNAGWTELSSSQNGTNGFLAYNYCQNGQCGYDDFVVSPAEQPGVAGGTGDLWLGGSMNYDELPGYAGAPPRSNGRGVIRSTNAGAPAADVTWADMSATIGSAPSYPFTKGIHPDQHAVVFASADPRIAFVGSDGGVVRIDLRTTTDKSAACDTRKNAATDEPLGPEDLADCKRLLKAIPGAIEPLNDGLNTIQFQSLSYNPSNPTGSLLGGTQDNGTWSFTGSPTWFETIGGDGGQSGFDIARTQTRYHNYYDATPEVNFKGDDPTTWLAIYDPLQSSKENRSFYVPFKADPQVGGRAFIGLEHVWRTDDNGGPRAYLEEHCNALTRDAGPCGDWVPMGNDLTSGSVNDRGGQFVVATERAESDKNTMWAATRTGRLWISKDAGSANPRTVHFTRLDTASTPGRFISGIAIDGRDPNHAWVSYSGYGAYTPGTPQHVIEVRYDARNPQRTTYTDRSYDLGDQPVTGIARNDSNGDLYAATDFGVLRLPAGGTSWLRAGTGFPNAAVYGLTLAQDAHVLYAASHGRGAWSLTLP